MKCKDCRAERGRGTKATPSSNPLLATPSSSRLWNQFNHVTNLKFKGQCQQVPGSTSLHHRHSAIHWDTMETLTCISWAVIKHRSWRRWQKSLDIIPSLLKRLHINTQTAWTWRSPDAHITAFGKQAKNRQRGSKVSKQDSSAQEHQAHKKHSQYCSCFNQFWGEEIRFGSFYNTRSIAFVKQLPLSVPGRAAATQGSRAGTRGGDQRCTWKQTPDLSADSRSLLPRQWNYTDTSQSKAWVMLV